MNCKIFGHKWNHYKEEVEQTISPPFPQLHQPFNITVDTQFRICDRCQYKQERKHFTGKDTDWHEVELSKEQLRNKKLKELGI
jgi:hypothetical protein